MEQHACPPSKLRQWRLAEGLTLDEVSGLTGYSVPMLSRVERGQRRLTPANKVRFARTVGVALRELFEPEEVDLEVS